ncbi:hypothetical protein ACFW1A_10015 [Kitasatospora sp. NPDC058965]|uniref:hypothetical protein n=1 Tax=Kitasatospora sp. NPDC058965 TaxID=3346682 RepID=UPI0036B41CD3
MTRSVVWLVLAARSRVTLAVLVAVVLVVDALSGESEQYLARTVRARERGRP